MRYADTDGNIYFVGQGIGGLDGPWMTLRRRAYGQSSQRVKSPALPLRRTREAAQADLDEWATARRFVAQGDAQ